MILVAVAILALLNWLFQNPNFLSPYYYKILVDVGIAVILAVSLNLINGITGQFSLGHAGFMGVGAYVAASLTLFCFMPALAQLGLSPQMSQIAGGIAVGVAVVVGGLSAILAGLVVGVPTLRLRGDYLAIATLGFGEIIRIVILNTEAVEGPRGLGEIPPLSSFFWVFVWVLVCLVVVGRLVYSVRGKAFFAIREDEFAASSIGIDVTRYKVLAFAIGSFFAGVAGGLFAHSATGYINPSQFDILKSIDIVMMVVLGGMGSITGAVLAAVILTVLPEALRLIPDLFPFLPAHFQAILRGFSEYRMVVYSLLLIVVMLTRPQGLMGMREFAWPRKKKLELKPGIE
jgi:branched-chain amino acid transport system permease protein